MPLNFCPVIVDIDDFLLLEWNYMYKFIINDKFNILYNNINMVQRHSVTLVHTIVCDYTRQTQTKFALFTFSIYQTVKNETFATITDVRFYLGRIEVCCVIPGFPKDNCQ